MNKLYLIVSFHLLICSFTTAQVINYKNSIRVGIDYMSLDAPDDFGLRYGVRYGRYFADDRIVIEGSLGYLNIKNRRLVINNFYFEGRPRQRVTADLTALYDLLGASRQALRLGGGLSVWHRKDEVLREARSFPGQNGQPLGIEVVSEKADETNPGFHLVVEYEYVIRARTSLGGRVGMANLDKAGISSFAGVNVGYRF
ncbi:outer membrane beta-barrel protein [Fibrella sp. HMF5335]|uniref:Outer membrane beta-barrel protein n=1 Tax=Fibrella rubiginis TaxID=2817060 RepID=A0A939GHC9_9BACT|nr:outer membrane beta-barrel protein [Fibrella rubiginis]MBO0936483.1 outer membrane beta-barrel protein [Fibrella rubiginis]